MGYALSGKTALVTGANRGIGEAIVDALVAAGVKKVYAAARNISTLDPLVDRHGSRVMPLQLDVTNAAQIAAAAATATDVDLLVNNAGIVGFFGGEFTDPKWIEGGRQEMEVNFLGTFAVTQAFAPGAREEWRRRHRQPQLGGLVRQLPDSRGVQRLEGRDALAHAGHARDAAGAEHAGVWRVSRPD